MTISRANRIACGLCLYFILLACFYAAMTPAFESPDEASHFLYIHNLLETRQLPVLEDRKIVLREDVFNSQSIQRHHPPLYYLIGALLISGTKRADLAQYLQLNPLASIGVVADNNQNVYLHPVPAPTGDTALAVWILRLYSIALGTATVWLIYRCAALIAGDSHLALMVALLVISIPTFVHISASINNDNLVILLYTAGVYLCLRSWKRRQLSVRDCVLASLILSAVALTKINGLTLFGIVYGWVLLGVFIKRTSWRQAARLILVSLGATALLAGWWYLRNAQLYGDPLALNATLNYWGRGGDPHVVSLSEAKGIWESFWFTLGYFNVRGPDWLYNVYLPIAIILAVCGVFYSFWRDRNLRLHLLFLAGIAILAVLTLLVATSRINVSPGRILFPGMVAFAPLLVIGWSKLGRRVGGLLIVPLTALSLITPLVYIAPAFSVATIVDVLPASARPVNISTGKITVLGYERLTDTIELDGWVRMKFYIQGTDAENPYLFVKALYPDSDDVLAGVDEYPGMLPTQSMHADLIYAIPVRFRLNQAALDKHPAPYQIQLVFGWRALKTDESLGGVYLPLQQANGAPIETPILEGPIVLNREPAPFPQNPVSVLYGNVIQFSGYTLSTRTLAPGQSLTVSLNWQYANPIDEDWTVTLGLLDAAGQPLTTADGAPAGYPTSVWRPGPSFSDAHTMTIPAGAKPGEYSLYVGWYRLSDGVRLATTGDHIRDNLYVDPLPIVVCAESPCPATNG